METDYDVVILGAGPAGLSVGSELSKKLKVLVVDKRLDQENPTIVQHGHKNEVYIHEPTKTTSAWFVPHDCFYDNEDLKDTRGKYGVKRFLAKTFDGITSGEDDKYDLEWTAKLFSEYDYYDRYPFIDENKIFNHWRKIIKESPHDSEIVFDHFYRDHLVTKEKVTVDLLRKKKHCSDSEQTETIPVTCKVLLDASGVDSGVLKDYEIQPKKYYWWSVYGCLAKHPNGSIGKNPDGPEPLKIGDYMVWQTFESTNIDKNASVRNGRPIFEYVIQNEDTSFIIILYLRKEMVALDFMNAQFMDILRNEHFTRHFHDVEITEFKYGWYPSGGLTLKTAKDRVAFIGNTGSWTTPCGWGMGFILKNYKPYSKGLIELVRNDKLDKKSLKGLVKLRSYQKTEFLVNKLATYFLANGTAKQLNKFINLFNLIDPKICERMFTLRIAPNEIIRFLRAAKKEFTWKEILDILPRHEYWSGTKDLIRLFIEIIPNLIYRLIFGKWPRKIRGFRVF